MDSKHKNPSKQKQLDTKTTANMLKERLIKTQQHQEAKRKETELQRVVERKLQLERRKQRILNQRLKMKKQIQKQKNIFKENSKKKETVKEIGEKETVKETERENKILIPKDSSVLEAIESLANFVLKNGVEFEEIVRKRNKNNKKFNFLFDISSSEYKYYQWKIRNLQKMEKLKKENEIQICEEKKCEKRKSKWNDYKEDNNINQKSLKITFDDLHEQEKVRVKCGGYYHDNDHLNETYNTAPPPLSLNNSHNQSSYSVQAPLNTQAPRKHMFSVIGVHETLKSDNFIPAKRRRRFTEKPSGDQSKRTQNDTISQIDFYAKNADQSDQRTSLPPVPESELLCITIIFLLFVIINYKNYLKTVEHSDKHLLNSSQSNKPVSSVHESNLKSRALLFRRRKLGAENRGHQILTKMGWKEGSRLGKQTVENERHNSEVNSQTSNF